MATSVADMGTAPIGDYEGAQSFSRREEFGELNGRSIRPLGSDRSVIIYNNSEKPVEQSSKIAACFKAIFSSCAVITLTGTILGCFSLNPFGGFLLGASASILLTPVIIAYQIAKAILS